jgi:hypothetical protein
MGGCFEFDDEDDENAYHYDEYDEDVNCVVQTPTSGKVGLITQLRKSCVN